MKIEPLAKMIPQEAEPLVIELVDRIGRLRSLSDDETDLVAAIVERERRRQPRRLHQWSKDDNRELLRIQHRPGGIQHFADERGLTYQAAFQQISRLRTLFHSEGGKNKPETHRE